jgi:hypothetical protein
MGNKLPKRSSRKKSKTDEIEELKGVVNSLIADNAFFALELTRRDVEVARQKQIIQNLQQSRDEYCHQQTIRTDMSTQTESVDNPIVEHWDLNEEAFINRMHWRNEPVLGSSRRTANCVVQQEAEQMPRNVEMRRISSLHKHIVELTAIRQKLAALRSEYCTPQSLSTAEAPDELEKRELMERIERMTKREVKRNAELILSKQLMAEQAEHVQRQQQQLARLDQLQIALDAQQAGRQARRERNRQPKDDHARRAS